MPSEMASGPERNYFDLVRQSQQNTMGGSEVFRQSATSLRTFNTLAEQHAILDLPALVELAIAVLSQDEARAQRATTVPEHLTQEIVEIIDGLLLRLDEVLSVSADPDESAVSRIDAALGFNEALVKQLERSGQSSTPETIIRHALESVLICLWHPIERNSGLSLTALRTRLADEIQQRFRRDFIFDIVTAYGAGWRRLISPRPGLQAVGWDQRWITAMLRLGKMTEPSIAFAVGWLRRYVDTFAEIFDRTDLEVNPDDDDERYNRAFWGWIHQESTWLSWQCSSDRDECPPAAQLAAWNPFARRLRQHLAVAVHGTLVPGQHLLGEEFDRSLLRKRLGQLIEMGTVATCICEQCHGDYLKSGQRKGVFSGFERESDGARFGVYEGQHCRAGHHRTNQTPIWAREKRFLVPQTEHGSYEEWECYQCANTSCIHLFDLSYDACPICGTPTNPKKKHMVLRLNARRGVGVIGRTLSTNLASKPQLAVDDRRSDLFAELIHDWYERYREQLVKISSNLIPIARKPKYRPLEIKGVWDLDHRLRFFQDDDISLPQGITVLVIQDEFDNHTPWWQLRRI